MLCWQFENRSVFLQKKKRMVGFHIHAYGFRVPFILKQISSKFKWQNIYSNLILWKTHLSKPYSPLVVSVIWKFISQHILSHTHIYIRTNELSHAHIHTCPKLMLTHLHPTKKSYLNISVSNLYKLSLPLWFGLKSMAHGCMFVCMSDCNDFVRPNNQTAS